MLLLEYMAYIDLLRHLVGCPLNTRCPNGGIEWECILVRFRYEQRNGNKCHKLHAMTIIVRKKVQKIHIGLLITQY